MTGFSNGKGDRCCQIFGMLRFDTERLEDCVRRSNTGCTVSCSASEAKAQMFPSIILNVSLFARWYWNVLKCYIISSPVYQTLIESIVNYRLFGTPVGSAYVRSWKHLPE